MAFNRIMQLAVATLSQSLPANPTVIELGNQRFRYDQAWTRYCGGVAGRKLREPIAFVWQYFEDLGFKNYVAIDINTELRSIAMDLNFNLKERYHYLEQFDLVTNNGTGEHIFDQRTVFENIHNLCRTNGLMLHVLPFGPWINHGFYNFNPNLFRDIAASNGYEWSLLWLAQNSGTYIEMPMSLDSWGFHEQKKPLAPPSILESAYQKLHRMRDIPTNISLVAAFRKLIDRPFRIPMQGRYVNDMVDGLRANYSATNLDVRQSDHTGAVY